METIEAARIFSALGQPTRLEILKIIAPYSHGKKPKGLPVAEIAAHLQIAPATLSFHLKDMTYKQLVIAERKGRQVFYRANTARLLSVLDELVTHILETPDD